MVRPLQQAARDVSSAARSASELIGVLTLMARDIADGKGAVSTSIAKTADGWGVVNRYKPPKEPKGCKLPPSYSVAC